MAEKVTLNVVAVVVVDAAHAALVAVVRASVEQDEWPTSTVKWRTYAVDEMTQEQYQLSLFSLSLFCLDGLCLKLLYFSLPSAMFVGVLVLVLVLVGWYCFFFFVCRGVLPRKVKDKKKLLEKNKLARK